MPPRPPPTELARQDWSDLSKRLTKYAFFRLNKKSWETAEEIAQEAITRVLDPAYAAWDREKHPEILDCLGSIVNGLVANHFRKKENAVKHVALREDERTHDDELPEIDARRAAWNLDEDAKPKPAVGALVREDATPEDLLVSPRERDAIDALRMRLHGDAIALERLDRIQRRDASPAAHARELGVDVKEIYAANKRVVHHARLVAKSLQGESEAS